MADTFLRTEGDYEIWSAEGIEYRRWAQGNSLGKAAKALASRHPKASAKVLGTLRKVVPGLADSFTGPDFGRGMAALKASKQAHRVELARLEAERGLMRAAESDRPGSGKLPAEAWGLVVERQADLALSGGGDSTKAARFVGETVGLVHPREGAGVQAVQLNVTIAADLADRYQATVIDVEIPADGEGSEPMPEGGPVLDALEVEPVEPEGGW